MEIENRLTRALDETLVREVNRRGGKKTEAIEWNQAYAWVLVGGKAMDRGFTVRELSVTYMPRGIRRIHQGPTRANGHYSYPGDFAFIDREQVCAQVHFCDLTAGDGLVVRVHVPIITVWVPRRLEVDWVTQEQPSDDAA